MEDKACLELWKKWHLITNNTSQILKPGYKVAQIENITHLAA